MGLRDFLFEKVDDSTQISLQDVLSVEDDCDVNTENVTQENLINDIYAQNDLSDVSKSIFKIEELINTLPKEMPNETKKATVLSMLPIFGLVVDDIAADGRNRISIIDFARAEIIQENNEIITNNSEMIENRKVEIQELEKDNTMREAVIKDTEDKIDDEIKRINKLIDFIGGVE